MNNLLLQMVSVASGSFGMVLGPPGTSYTSTACVVLVLEHVLLSVAMVVVVLSCVYS